MNTTPGMGAVGLTPEQRQIRAQGIGASEVAAVVGCHPFKSVHTLYDEKIGVLEPEPAGERAFWGHALEPAIATAYGVRQGVDVRLTSKETKAHPSHPWALASPDALAYRGGWAESWLVEIKNAGINQARFWEDGPPEHYQIQCQWQMFVTDHRRCDLVALIGGNDLRIHELRRDEELIDILFKAARSFWERVQRREPPEPDGSEGAWDHLRRRYPRDGEQTIVAGVEAEKLAQLYLSAKREREKHELAEAWARNQLCALIGPAQGIEGETWRATWRRTKDSTAINWEAVARELGATPEVIAKHSKAREGVRRFLFTESTP